MQCPCLAARSFAFAMPSVAMQRRSRSFLRFALTSLRCANPCSSIALLRAALCDALAVHSNAVPSQSCTILCPGIARRGHAFPLQISPALFDAVALQCNAFSALPPLYTSLLCFAAALPSYAIPRQRCALLCSAIALQCFSDAVLCLALPMQCSGPPFRGSGKPCWASPLHHWPDRQRARVGAEM